MNDDQTPDSPEDLGNTIDGTGAGDGDAAAETRDEPTGADGGPQTPSSAASPQDQIGGNPPSSGTQGASHHDREEQKKVYLTPEQPDDRAVGGPEGTADGM